MRENIKTSVVGINKYSKTTKSTWNKKNIKKGLKYKLEFFIYKNKN